MPEVVALPLPASVVEAVERAMADLCVPGVAVGRGETCELVEVEGGRFLCWDGRLAARVE
ncbi:MAG: hypothetical protein ACKVVT_17320 [Dehalococcoidia bacterium]